MTRILFFLALLIQREDQNPSPPHIQSLPVIPVAGTIVGGIIGSVVGAVGYFNVGGGAGAASGASGAIHSNIPPPQIRQGSTGHKRNTSHRQLFSWRTSQRAVSGYNYTTRVKEYHLALSFLFVTTFSLLWLVCLLI